MPLNLILVGCGKMGGALLHSWEQQGSFEVCHVVDPALGKDLTHVPPEFVPDVVIIAVKPQAIAEVLPAYRKYAGQGALYVSIAAGTRLSALERHLGSDAAVVRAMPNTPASIGKGITVMCANARVEAPARARAEKLLSAVGKVEWVDQENALDAVTAVSGSGPAYVFLLIEALAAAGIEQGLSEDLAVTLARQTVIGAAALAEHEKDTSAAILRENVTSPGGTTEAALKVLMPELEVLIKAAVEAAVKRSKDLSG